LYKTGYGRGARGDRKKGEVRWEERERRGGMSEKNVKDENGGKRKKPNTLMIPHTVD